MSLSRETLQTIAESETVHFCNAEQQLDLHRMGNHKRYDDPLIHARRTNCGIATALLQHTLREYHGIETTRLVGEPPQAPRTSSGRTFSHVILQHDRFIIDPTSGQLASYMGLDHADKETALSHYPSNAALVIDTTKPEEGLEPFVDSLMTIEQLEHVRRHKYGPLRNLGRQAVSAAVYDIYNLDHYRPFPVEPFLVSYDYIEGLKQTSDSLRSEIEKDAS